LAVSYLERVLLLCSSRRKQERTEEKKGKGSHQHSPWFKVTIAFLKHLIRHDTGRWQRQDTRSEIEFQCQRSERIKRREKKGKTNTEARRTQRATEKETRYGRRLLGVHGSRFSVQ
jgi:hypothetical protein